MREEQTCLFDDNPEYDAFIDKFKPKKTTDDCYTPPLIYDVVRDWACQKYSIDPSKIVRPFYPEEDYEDFLYPDGCVVLDNPPFSILSQICRFYLSKNISFFLFAPSLTALNQRNDCLKITHILCDANIEYENGAIVRTAFLTNMGGDVVAETAPELGKAIAGAMAKTKTERVLPKYAYPDYIVTAAMMQRWAHYGIHFSVKKKDCVLVSKLDAQSAHGKAIFGGGLILSKKAAAEKAAAEKAAAEKAAAEKAAAEKAGAIIWQLSDRERAIVAKLGEKPEGEPWD